MKRSRISALLLVCAMAVSTMAACGTGTSSSADSAPAAGSDAAAQSDAQASPAEAGGESAKLDFMWFSDGVEGEVTQELVAAYQEQNPNIQINLIEVPFSDIENKLRISISGGEPPAMARMTNAAVGTFKDVSLTLNDYTDSDALVAQFSDSLQPYYIFDGQVKAVPIDVTANGLIYNKTAFDAAGVAVPTTPDNIWTVDEWMESMKKVMENSDVKYGLVIDKTMHRFSTLLYGQGGQFISDDGTQMVINNEAGVASVDLMKRLHDEKIAPDSVWVGSENPNEMFRTGQVAMHLAGSWMMTNYRDNITDFEWGVTYLPVGARRSSVPGGKYLMAFVGSGVEQQAVDFLEYFSSKEANEKYCLQSLFLSPRKDCADIQYDFAAEYFAIFSNELENTPAAPALDWGHPRMSNAIQQDFMDGVADVITGKTDAKTMLDKIAEIGNEALQEE